MMTILLWYVSGFILSIIASFLGRYLMIRYDKADGLYKKTHWLYITNGEFFAVCIAAFLGPIVSAALFILGIIATVEIMNSDWASRRFLGKDEE